VITRCEGTGLVAALTFDDGPNGRTTERLLDFLEDRDIRATFCLIGENIAAPGGAEIVRRMVRNDHVLCNHGTSYADMGDWSRDAIEADLRENLRIIRAAAGDQNVPVPYFRAPNGTWGQTSSVAAVLGMRSLGVINVIDDWKMQDIRPPAGRLTSKRIAGVVEILRDLRK
jgi:endo-1,4-beta-xylanase